MRWVDVAGTGEVTDGGTLRVDADGCAVVVVRTSEGLFALSDTCTHEEASLADGFVDPEDGVIECPRHGAHFDLHTGQAVTLPATHGVSTWPVREEGGRILVARPEEGEEER